MIYIGIDPGFASGAYTLISDNTPGGKIIRCNNFQFFTNKGKKEIDFMHLYNNLKRIKNRTVVTVIENQSARPNQACGTTFKIGGGFIGLQLIFKILQIPFVIVTPKKWKNFYNLGQDKADSRKLAMQLYPYINLEKGVDEHRAESLLLARYGMYLHGILKK